MSHSVSAVDSNLLEKLNILNFRMKYPVQILFKILAILGILQNSSAADEDLDVILKDVEIWGCDGCGPGLMTIFGDQAFPILSSEYYTAMHPAAGAARYGNGRVVAFPHDDFMQGNSAIADSVQFLQNSIAWASNNIGNQVINAGILTGAQPQVEELHAFLLSIGYYSEQIDYSALLNLTDSAYDIILITQMLEMKSDIIETLKEYVFSGGALVMACTSWARPELFVDGFVGNKIIHDMGMEWIAEYSYPTLPNNHYNASKDLLKLTHANEVSLKIIRLIEDTEAPSDDESIQLSSIISTYFSISRKEALPSFKQLKETMESIKPLIPTPENPVISNSSTKFQSVLEQILYNHIQHPFDIKAHPSSASFPGLSPTGISREVNVTLHLNRNLERYLVNQQQFLQSTDAQRAAYYSQHWYSTGFYAPAGQPILVEIEDADKEIQNFEIQIGCHTDDISRLDEWVRFPAITKRAKITGNVGITSSPFGGLIYLKSINTKLDSTLENLNVKINGALPIASFKLGETTLADWNDIRKHEAPWAEFISDRVVLSIPGPLAQSIDDPETLMTYWNESINVIADLSGRPKAQHFERLVFDVEISAGYMHSGYPIMAFLPSAEHAVNITRMQGVEGDTWGFYHEVGHNNQKSYWTLEEGGEVTCNIFAMLVLNVHAGHAMVDTRPHIFHPENLHGLIQGYLDGGTNYEDLQDDVDLFLVFYYQLQDIFGWQAYQDVFAAYENMESKPSTPDDIRDEWLIQFSLVAGENLAALFRSWGIPFSSAAEERIAHLPLTTHGILDLVAG